jgi:soluble P-type ATPase
MRSFPEGGQDFQALADKACIEDGNTEAAMALYAIPGQQPIEARHLVLDYNGSLATDGALIPGVAEGLRELALPPYGLCVHVVTADTNGTARRQLEGLPCVVSILGPQAQDRAKLEYVQNLGAAWTVAVGNGYNDRLMLAEAALGIVVIGEEGAAVQTVLASRVACLDMLSALDLLRRPHRLAATLRC